MIVPHKNSHWAQLVFSLNGTIATKIWKRLLLVIIFAAAVTYLHEQHLIEDSNPLEISHFSLINFCKAAIGGPRGICCGRLQSNMNFFVSAPPGL